MKKTTILCGVILSGLLLAGRAQAHTALFACMDNGDGSVTCEGGFSDGSSASGVPITIKDSQGKILLQGKTDKLSAFVFKKPKGTFKVIFDAGPGHVVEIRSGDISG